MRIEVLYVPGCPHAGLLAGRVAQLTGGRVQIQQHTVGNIRQAEALGMRGSPTLLVDGIDPFADANQPPSLSCRLYRDETGTLAGVPSLAQLREVLEARGTSHVRAADQHRL